MFEPTITDLHTAVAESRTSASATAACVGVARRAEAVRSGREVGLARLLQGGGLSTSVESRFFGVVLGEASRRAQQDASARVAAAATMAATVAASTATPVTATPVTATPVTATPVTATPATATANTATASMATASMATASMATAATAATAGLAGMATGLGALPDWADAHPIATALEGMVPGVDLATALVAIDADEADDAALVEAIAGWERMASWVTARQAVVVNELRRRRESQGRDSYAGDEVAARLGTTRAAGEGRVADSWCLERLPAVFDALESGQVDPRKARILCDELLAAPETAREAICARILPQADRLTGPTIRSRIRRMALAADPGAAQARHVKERADRHVELVPVCDGMAWIHAYLPADAAVAIHTTLTAIADAQPSDDPRGMDARRADALTDLVTRWLDAGTTPDGVPLPTRQHRHPHLTVTATLESILGLDDAPGHLAGHGPLPAAMVRALAARSTWTPVLVDANEGVLARGARTYRPTTAQADQVLDRDRTCTFPGCRIPAARCDIDHIEPFDPDHPAEAQTTETNLHALCRHHHRLKTHGGWQVTRDPATGITHWTAPTGHPYRREPEPLVVDPGPPPAGPMPDTAGPPAPSDPGPPAPAAAGPPAPSDPGPPAPRDPGPPPF